MKKALLSLVFVLFAGFNALAATQINSGSHTISYVTNEGIQVRNSAEVKLVNGGVVGIAPDSQSTWKYFQAYDTSKIVIDGGQVNGKLYTYHNSTALFLNGTVTGDCLTLDNSKLIFMDGTVNRNGYFKEDSSVTLSGGTIGGEIFCRDNAKIDISGGTFTHIHAEDESITTIYGRDFKIDGVSVGYGLLNDVLEDLEVDNVRNLTGIFQNGQSLNCDLIIGNYHDIPHDEWGIEGSIYLVPEPATLLLVGIGAVMIRRKL